MKNLKWVKTGDSYILQNDDSLLLTLEVKPGKDSVFILNNRQYAVVQKGFWSSAYYVISEGEEIVKLSHGFWGSKGKIDFNDGSVYLSAYSSSSGLKMQFTDAGKEILTYGMAFENKRPELTFTVSTAMIDAEKLLILAALGMVVFSVVYKEMAGDGDGTALILLSTAT